MHGRTRRGAAVAAAIALSLSLVACGDDDIAMGGTDGGDNAEPDTADAGAGNEPSDADAGPTGDDAAPTTTAASPARPAAAPPPDERLESLSVGLEELVDLPLLTAMATRPADGALYFLSQTGEVWRFVDGEGDAVLALDLTDQVSEYQQGSERGLLGIAFHPIDGRLYLYFTDVDIHSNLVSYELAEDGTANLETRREVLFEEQPGLGHKGGGLVFMDDGTLFVAFGDGGASQGRDSQDNSKVLGTIIRIVPNLDGDGYETPDDNPFVGVEGDDGEPWRPEIWATGLRNPWGFCHDEPSGRFWLADVGDAAMEEINRFPANHAGLNFGWPYFEGTEEKQSGAPEGVVPPVYAYGRDEGVAAIGGCVYRGEGIPGLDGAYLFGDMSGPLMAMGADDEVVGLTSVPSVLTGIYPDADGEMIVLSLRGGAFRLVGH